MIQIHTLTDVYGLEKWDLLWLYEFLPDAAALWLDVPDCPTSEFIDGMQGILIQCLCGAPLSRVKHSNARCLIMVDCFRDLGTDIVEMLDLDYESLPGFTFIHVNHPAKALLLAATIMPDFIVTDIRFSGMDGFKGLELLLAQPMTQHIPFGILTAATDTQNIQQSKALGAKFFISKPFRCEELLDELSVHFHPIPGAS